MYKISQKFPLTGLWMPRWTCPWPWPSTQPLDELLEVDGKRAVDDDDWSWTESLEQPSGRAKCKKTKVKKYGQRKL